jgi:Fic family protein
MNRLDKRLLFNSEISAKVYNLIAKIDTIKGQWKITGKLSPQMISRLKTSILITSTGASTRIEGAKLSDTQIEKLFSNIKIKKLKTRDEQEVIGYLELLKNVFNSWENLNFSESLILNFHKELLKYSAKDQKHKGNYKFDTNRVEARDVKGKLVGIVFNPTPPYLVRKEMEELIFWTKKELKADKVHVLLVVANFIFEFLAIHPFTDGNGRLSRVLTNFLLLKAGYEYIPYISHEKIIENNKAEYYLSLNKTQKTWKKRKEEITPWILFFLEAMYKQSELALKLITEESVEEFLSEKQLLVWRFALNSKIFQRADAIKATKLKPRTVEQSIKKLLSMHKIIKLGQGKATRYRIK